MPGHEQGCRHVLQAQDTDISRETPTPHGALDAWRLVKCWRNETIYCENRIKTTKAKHANKRATKNGIREKKGNSEKDINDKKGNYSKRRTYSKK